MKKLVIATRGSMLALWQANHIKSLIEARHSDIKVELNVIKTMGDKILDVPLAKIGGKGLFVKEIENALLDGSADLAVHSMKDVPVDLPQELEIFANPIAEEPNDAFLSVKYNGLAGLPQGAKVGTSSLRRKLQLLKVRPDLQIEDLRGNVDTRIKKMTDGMYDAIILAKAGLNRLDMTAHVKESISTDLMIPSVCQGVLGIEVRKNDDNIKAVISFLQHNDTQIKVAAERAFLHKLEGGCQAPIACHAVLKDGKLFITGLLSSLDGKTWLKSEIRGDAKDAKTLGTSLANDILAKGGKAILKEIYL